MRTACVVFSSSETKFRSFEVRINFRRGKFDEVRIFFSTAAYIGTQVSEKIRNSQILVGLSGLEPPTSRLSGVRSNRLSYRPMQGFSGLKFPYPSLSIFRLECSCYLLSALQINDMHTQR